METYLCRKGDPWGPNDLDRAIAEAEQLVAKGATGVMVVDHWRLADMPLSVARGRDDAIRVTDSGDLVVAVFHDRVDPRTRICEDCGKSCGKSRGRFQARR